MIGFIAYDWEGRENKNTFAQGLLHAEEILTQKLGYLPNNH